MNNSGQNGNDILGKYINPESIEKAPEGLTEKIMIRIQVEKAPLRISGRFRLNVLVPAILIYIVIGFFILTLFDRALNRMFHK